MKMTITRYGMPQVLIVPLILIAVGVVLVLLFPGAGYWPLVTAAVLALAALGFFRDPYRQIPNDENVLLAPADGKITDIIEMDEPEFITGRALRVGIFLSVFDVHLNRMPCAGKVGYIRHQPGKCLNAMRSEAASQQNQAALMGLNCPESPAGKVMVKQITGAIARRIVCACKTGDEFTAGQQYGMIKFGSRTELFLPVDKNAEVIVKPGQTVRAGTTIMVRYKQN
jgi:phosphatidylserine decarboxylase